MTDAQQQNTRQSLSDRLSSRFGSSQNANTQTTDNSQSGNSQNSGTNSNQQNTPAQRPPAPQPARSRFSPFGNRQSLNWEMVPVYKTVVRIDLQGLGDPFYKLLDQPLNTELSDSQAVAKALQTGGESVDTLKQLLDHTWENYDLTGAALVYRWVPDHWKGLAAPSPMPTDFADLFEDAEDEAEKKDDKQTPPPDFTCLRALDLPLVLNILARARTQVLLAQAPLIFSQQYLNRTLIVDDPRIIDLVRATGYLEESFAS